jgi:hypothetical protein
MVLPMLVALSALVTDPFWFQDPGRREEHRRQWEEMSEEERQELVERWERWKALSREEREEIRKRHEKLQDMSEEEREKVRDNFDRFQDMKPMFQHRWNIQQHFLDQLPEEERKRIEALPREKRQKEIEKLIRRKWLEKMKAFVDSLPPEKRKELDGLSPEKWRERVGQLMREEWVEKVQAFVDSLPEETRKELDGLPEEERRRRIWWLMWERKWGKRGPGPGKWGPRPGEWGPRRHRIPTDEEIREFAKTLTPEQKKVLKTLPLKKQKERIIELMREKEREKQGPGPGFSPRPWGGGRR